MIKIFFTLVFLLGFFICKAQSDINVIIGEEYQASKKSTLSGLIGYDDSGIYTLSTKGYYNRELTIVHFDNKLTKTKSAELELITDKKERGFEHALHSNGKIFIFSSFRNQKLKKNILFVQTLNKQTLALNNDLKMIAEVDNGSRYNSGDFNFKVSVDKSKIMIFYTLPYEKLEPEKFGFHIFDADLNQIWTKSISLPYTDELFGINSYKVDNKGNVFILGKIYEEKRKEVRRGKANYKYVILSYTKKGELFKEYIVAMEGLFLTDMQIAITDDEDIVCAGFYSDRGTFSIKGTYFFRVDGETKNIVSKSLKEFDLNFLTMEMTEKEAEKTKKKMEKGKDTELYEYDLDNLILRSDGGAVLVGEQYFVRVVTHTTTNANGGTTTTTTYHYHYNDIIVININPQGNIEWAVKVPKTQHTVNDGGFFSSYALAVVKDKLYLVFNDNPKNLLELKQGQNYNFRPHRESVVVLVTVDKNGNTFKMKLFSSAETETVTRPKVCEQISDNEMVIFGQKKTTQRFARINFK
jgi:hypothetical protein